LINGSDKRKKKKYQRNLKISFGKRLLRHWASDLNPNDSLAENATNRIAKMYVKEIFSRLWTLMLSFQKSLGSFEKIR